GTSAVAGTRANERRLDGAQQRAEAAAWPAPEREMSRARLLFSESWASIRQNLSTTVAATMTVLIGMCLLGLFIALGSWVLSWSNHLQDQLRVKVNFCTMISMQGECSHNATTAQEA